MNNKENLKSRKQYLLSLNTTVAILIRTFICMHDFVARATNFVACSMLITTPVDNTGTSDSLDTVVY